MKWHKVTLTFTGVYACEDASPNPFTNYRLIVNFTKGNKTYAVPGFFAADGNAAHNSATCGDKWQVHFTPDESGTWNYLVSFSTGNNIAIDDNPVAGNSVAPINRMSGSITIGESNKTGRDFRGKGKLRYAGGHHLKFDNGVYFLKGGCGSPENLLAYWEFDGTYDNGNGTNGLTNGLHRFSDHVQDWNSNDPAWQNGKGKGILGAMNYLAEQGLNAVYFITMNIDGDGDDVWPYTSPSQRDRFDVSKLAQWEILFSHLDSLGIMLHIVTQEKENQLLLDNGALGNFRKLYYRELISRFAHHNAITWNLGEENGPQGGTNAQSDQQRKDMAMYFKTHDPYNSFVTVHNLTGDETELFGPLLGYPHFDGISAQGDKHFVNSKTIQWRNNSANAGRKWVVCHDETTGGVPTDASASDHDLLRVTALWGNYMAGGGGVEWYFGSPGDINAETFRSRSGMWRYTKIANDFFNNYVPFWEMTPANSLTSAGNDFCFAKAGEVYVIYLVNTATTNINLPPGNYAIKWYNPETGGNLLSGSKSTTSGGNTSIGNPPYSHSDWAVLITSTTTPPPSCSQPEVVSLTLVNTDGSEISSFTNGYVINLSTLGDFSVRANVCGAVGSVRFFLNGSLIKNENIPPYSINGDANGGYYPWNVSPGNHALTVSPYSGSNGNGTSGISHTVSFSVIQQHNGCASDSECNDADPCTSDQCLNGECENTLINCDDNDLCTIDECENGVCVHEHDDECGECQQPEVSSFSLVRESGSEIGFLNNGAVINLSTIGSFSIKANTCSNIGSIEFELNGDFIRYENYEPYSINGDNAGSYAPWNPAPGNYTLTAIPYSDVNGTGSTGLSRSVSFSVIAQQIACTQLEVVSFSLVSAANGTVLTQISPGMVIDKSQLPDFSIRANVCDDPVGSVRFILNGNVVREENYPPYSINGDYSDGRFTPWNPNSGNYTLTGIPFSGLDATGNQGISETVSFSVVNGSNKKPETGEDNSGYVQKGKNSELRIAPNPFSNELYIHAFTSVPEIIELNIYDAMGVMHYKRFITLHPGENTISLISDIQLQDGLYFVKTISNSRSETTRVLKIAPF